MATVAEKAEALRRSLDGAPWLEAVGVDECSGKPLISVYVSGGWPQGAIPGVWRGVPVCVSRARFRPAREE